LKKLWLEKRETFSSQTILTKTKANQMLRLKKWNKNSRSFCVREKTPKTFFKSHLEEGLFAVSSVTRSQVDKPTFPTINFHYHLFASVLFPFLFHSCIKNSVSTLKTRKFVRKKLRANMWRGESSKFPSTSSSKLLKRSESFAVSLEKELYRFLDSILGEES
jgi:hypothetical protein